MSKTVKTVRQQENDAVALRGGAGLHGKHGVRRRRDERRSTRQALRSGRWEA